MLDQPDRELAVFSAARQLQGRERIACLDEACGGDQILRQHVEELLQASEAAGAFLERPASGLFGKGGTVPRPTTSAERPGDRIGHYQLVQPIGEGGCGVVYLAEQVEPVRREVALKVIKLGMDTKNVIARFEAERQSLALMDHPNIAKVLDAGATEAGRPYFVMELVRGIKITDYCDKYEFSTQQRLELFIQVCRAVQHAHQKGIIHRDLKPSNILVTMSDGVAIPKVIDFGIAKATHGKLTDQTVFTAFEQFIGTPAYMSPEQAEIGGEDVDTRSDIYSLGVLLYELLTGRTPFDATKLLQAGLDEVRRTIREEEPARPSTRLNTMLGADLTEVGKHRKAEPPKLIHLVRGDLDWIVMKALEKDRTRRYETANGLAMDLLRHLHNEPVVACPPGNLYKFQKLVRRNKLVFTAAGCVAAALILALGVALVAMVRIQSENRQIRQAKDDATEKLRSSYLAQARATRISGQTGQRFASLEAVRKAAAIRPDLEARNAAIACLAVSDLRLAKAIKFNGPAPKENVVLPGYTANDLLCYDPHLVRYAVGGEIGSITIHAATNDLALAVLPAPGFALERIFGFSPNSKYLCARYRHERAGDQETWDSVWIWDVDQQKPLIRDLRGRDETHFSADSRYATRCQTDGTISIYDLGSGAEFRRFPGTRQCEQLILNSGNTRLACASDKSPKVEIREVNSGRNLITLNCPTRVSAIAWSPDGRSLATACWDFCIYIWDAETGQRQATLTGHSQEIVGLAYNHAGSLLASSSFDSLARLWEANSGRLVATYPGRSLHLQFSPEDHFLTGLHQSTRYFSLEIPDCREYRQLNVQRDEGNVSRPGFSTDGRVLAAGSNAKVRFWDARSGQEIGTLPLRYCDTHIFHPDGRSLITIDQASGVRLRSLTRIDGPDLSAAYRLASPHHFYDATRLREAALSLDGRHLAVTHETGAESFILDLHDPSAKPIVLQPHHAVTRIAISPDAHWAATASRFNSQVKIWDARSGELVRTLELPGTSEVAFSTDGQWLATSTTEYQLWAVGSWQPKGPPKPGNEIPEWNYTAFSPDGRVMARSTEANTIQLLDATTERPLATLEAPGSSPLAKFQFSPDGSQLAAAQYNQQVQLWDLRLIRHELANMNLDWDQPPYPPSTIPAGAAPVTLEVEADTPGQDSDP